MRKLVVLLFVLCIISVFAFGLYIRQLGKINNVKIENDIIIYNFNNKKYKWRVIQPWLELESGNPNVSIGKNFKSYPVNKIKILNALNCDKYNPQVIFFNLDSRIKMFTKITENIYELKDKDGEYRNKWLNTFFSEAEFSGYGAYDDRKQVLVYTITDFINYEEYGITNNTFDLCNRITIDFPAQFPDFRGIYYSYPDDMIVIVTGDEYTENTLLDKLKDKPVLIKRIQK
jgi:hypothetical protein